MHMKTRNLEFNCHLSPEELRHYAAQYSYASKVEIEAEEAAKEAKKRGYLTKSELQAICEWKTPRSKPRVEENSESFVEEVTRIALGTSSEKLRVEILTLLSGVRWPTASTILCFCHKEEYPILDFRALETLGRPDIKPNHYCFELWNAYVNKCRAIANNASISVRELDKALWEYSKINS